MYHFELVDLATSSSTVSAFLRVKKVSKHHNMWADISQLKILQRLFVYYLM